MFGLGIWELLIILLIVLLIFGGRRLPQIGRSLGEMVGELQKVGSGSSGNDKPDKESGEENVEQAQKSDTLSQIKDIASLGTPSGRRGLLGRFIRKGRF